MVGGSLIENCWNIPEKARGSGWRLLARDPSPRPAPPAHSRPLHGASPEPPPGVAVVTLLPSPPGRRRLYPGRSAWLGKARPGVSAGTRLLPNPPIPRPAGETEGGEDAVGLTVICRLGWSLPVTRGRWACRVKGALMCEFEVGRRRPEVLAGAPGVRKTCAPRGGSVDLTAEPPLCP